MGERAKIIINEYTALEILQRPDFDINKFYSSDYRIFITALLKENERLKKRENELQEKFKDWKKEIEKEKKYYLCERTDCCGRIKDSKKYSSIYCELKDYKSKNEKAIEYVNTHKPSDTISFPLMKKDEENQVKSCFDYEFREIYQKDLLNILQGVSNENSNE